ncbi:MULTISPECIES: hypothetical protein [Sporomusaceae]|uniref:hypothetical protein n=1 Tax=Sporomusaceae TaxID=1843490 RepID=UPI00036C9B30|nr:MULTISPECIES: hypothetical protein [Sporomusaceae]
MKETTARVLPPLDGPAVRKLEDALLQSPSKSILLRINQTLVQLSREGNWFKFAVLTRKRTIKRASVFESLTEIYNDFIHGQDWQIATLPSHP